MEEENLFEYEGVSYPESALREIYPETFDEYVEQGILKKLGDDEPVDVVDTQEESLYEYDSCRGFCGSNRYGFSIGRWFIGITRKRYSS